jgi:hypothetical protein
MFPFIGELAANFRRQNRVKVCKVSADDVASMQPRAKRDKGIRFAGAYELAGDSLKLCCLHSPGDFAVGSL